MNYCWTHGCDDHDWHTSATCPNPRQGYLLHATRNNVMGGNTMGSHKVWMGPPQCQPQQQPMYGQGYQQQAPPM
eukprot:12965252-Ditylum_brightwellii.AAC.1